MLNNHVLFCCICFFVCFFFLLGPDFSSSLFTPSTMSKQVIFQTGKTRRGKQTIVQKVVKPPKVIPKKRDLESPFSGDKDDSPRKTRRTANQTHPQVVVGGHTSSPLKKIKGKSKKSGKVSDH
jgi:hypothetical protein